MMDLADRLTRRERRERMPGVVEGTVRTLAVIAWVVVTVLSAVAMAAVTNAAATAAYIGVLITLLGVAADNFTTRRYWLLMLGSALIIGGFIFAVGLERVGPGLCVLATHVAGGMLWIAVRGIAERAERRRRERDWITPQPAVIEQAVQPLTSRIGRRVRVYELG